MTDYCILFVGEGVGWRRSRKPTPSQSKTLIVIQSEAKNLSQSFIYKSLPDNTD